MRISATLTERQENAKNAVKYGFITDREARQQTKKIYFAYYWDWWNRDASVVCCAAEDYATKIVISASRFVRVTYREAVRLIRLARKRGDIEKSLIFEVLIEPVGGGLEVFAASRKTKGYISYIEKVKGY